MTGSDKMPSTAKTSAQLFRSFFDVLAVLLFILSLFHLFGIDSVLMGKTCDDVFPEVAASLVVPIPDLLGVLLLAGSVGVFLIHRDGLTKVFMLLNVIVFAVSLTTVGGLLPALAPGIKSEITQEDYVVASASDYSQSVKLIEEPNAGDYVFYCLVGSITNTSGRPWDNARFEFVIYSSQGLAEPIVGSESIDALADGESYELDGTWINAQSFPTGTYDSFEIGGFTFDPDNRTS